MNKRLSITLLYLVVIALTVLSCSTTPSPTPTSAPSKPTTAASPVAAPSVTTAPGAKASAASSPAAKPSVIASPSAKTGASADWKQQWDAVVAASNKEGKVVVRGGPGELYRTAALAFQKVYPDISVEYTGGSGSEFVTKLVAERNGGQFLYDVNFGGADSPLLVLKPNGALDPLRPALILPEVLDDTSWQGGFADGWVDKEKQFLYAYSGYLQYDAYVNRAVVSESELNTVDQLLDPKWKGKIVILDPRRTGPTSASFGFLVMAKGADWLRKLMEQQDLFIVGDSRQQAELLVRGTYPIAMGVDTAGLVSMQREGLGGDLKPLAPDSEDGAGLMNGFGNLMLINKAPHPNAAKVFINWLLSKDGQKAYVEATAQNSRRVDVPGPEETAPKPDRKYVPVQREENQPNLEKAIELAKEIIK